MRINVENIPQDKIRIIIFDLGGVIMDVDTNKTLEAFADLHITGLDREDIIAENATLFRELELGLLTEAEFIEKLHQNYPVSQSIPEEQIWKAWDAMLLPFLKERIEVVNLVRRYFKTYLLSNTNLPHRTTYEATFKKQFGYPFETLFEHCFYSDELHKRKPDANIYEQVIRDLAVDPSTVFFIDDNLANVKEAVAQGWNAYQLTNGETILDLFNE